MNELPKSQPCPYCAYYESRLRLAVDALERFRGYQDTNGRYTANAALAAIGALPDAHKKESGT